MSLLWRLVFASRCSSTHHKLALDALRFVRGPQADQWGNLFLSNHEQYLTGSKAPDNDFRDFKNHVLHVKENFWGGATASAREWYGKTVEALAQGDWPTACYNAGVLSHYFMDPFQPFHTGQTEAEGQVHRPAEWSICKSYEDLQAILEHDLTGYPEYELPVRTDWLEETIRQGAITAHESYDICIDHYDLTRGIKDPPSGLDQELKDRIARMIGLAVVGFARVLERAIDESGATPPDVAVSLQVLIAGMKVPLNFIRKKLTDAHDRAVVEAIYLELQEKGKVIDALPEDERTVRKLHANEVLKLPVRQLDAEPVRPAGKAYGTGQPARGETVKSTRTAGFQRTITTTPALHTESRRPAPQLEACLMVPLATSPPVDYVADAAVRAYLNQPTARTASVNTPAPARGTGSLSAPVQPQGASLAQTSLTEVTPTSRAIRSGTAAPAETRSRAVTENSPARKRAVLVDDYEPVMPTPELPVALSGVDAATESPAEMFAPLPSMPRVAAAGKAVNRNLVAGVPASVDTKAPTPVLARPAQAGMAATVKPTVAQTVSPAKQASLPPEPKVPAPGNKKFIIDPAVRSAVPAPHVRLPEPDEEQFAGDSSGRSESTEPNPGYDFQGFSTSAPMVPTPVPRPDATAKPRDPVKIPAPPPVQPQSTAANEKPGGPAIRRRFYLELTNPVVDAPSIGPKVAERLHAIGIKTIQDLLQASARDMAGKLGNPAAEPVIRDWQLQTALVLRVPNLRGHDAQFLTGCQIRTPEQLRSCDPEALHRTVDAFVKSAPGQRLLRGGTPPDVAEVTEWIVAAREAREMPAR